MWHSAVKGGFAMLVGTAVASSVASDATDASGWQAVRLLAAQVLQATPDAVEITPMPRLNMRGNCLLFTARQRQLLDGPVFAYAVLPDHTVIGPHEQGSATQVLRVCGEGADAHWWANVVSRFADAGGMLVDEHAPSVTRRIKASGATDHHPVMERTAASTVVTFYTHDYALNQTWRVTATLASRGELTIDKQALNPSSPP
ncbi:MAG: hypothetical protein Q4G71_01295 [Pseudomonadota bacterium]|nr:hypothetical protein [Pseudomonadota bacterium]